MTTGRIEMPDKLVPVFMGEADVRGAWGGRGSGKTRTFAKMTAVRALMWAQAGREGIVLCLRQFMNSLADSSLEEIKHAIRETPWLTPHFDIGEKYIRTADGRVSYSFAGLDRNIDSIKSTSRILLAWVDEAEPVTEEAWAKLIPTLREEDSELWVTWNRERKKSATNRRFGGVTDDRTKIIELNWRDNPWFPDILNRVRLKDLEERPDSYDHVWEGDYRGITEGAYYAKSLTLARAQGRIGRVSADPLMTIRAVWDIGGTGAKADATAIWIVQHVGREIRLLDYYEAVGQPLATHVAWLRAGGYEAALCVLPHDGASHEKVIHTTYQGSLEAAGFSVRVVPNQGAGAAMQRIEAARRLFPQMYFDAEKCAGGIEAIGAYHEKRDEKREIGLGPAHDWASHGCFAPDTLVLTRQGLRQIDSLNATGEVMTPCGWKAYHSPRITLAAAPLVEVRFDDGYSVRCTPDHLFLTENGWKSAESLTKGTEIQSFWTQRPSILTGGSTGFGRARVIMQKAVRSCIARYGASPSVKSLRSAMSIIGTKLQAITAWLISNAWTALSIFGLHGQTAPSPKCQRMNISPTLHGNALLTGTNQRRGVRGTGSTLSDNRHGRSGSESRGHATSVALNMMRWFAPMADLANTVLGNARSRLTKPTAKRPHTKLRIAAVKHLIERSDVWDITVPDGHWFTLANGAVVHNSDAFGLVAVAYEPPRQAREITYSKRGIV